MTHDELQRRCRAYFRQRGLKPGDKLDTELDLARRFRVSRGAMREVLMHFCHMGLLERVKNRGTFLRKVSPEQMEEDVSLCFELAGFSFEELKEARLSIETAVIPLVVKRISPAAVAELRANLAAMEAKVKRPAAADVLDRDFHLLLLNVCNNRTLMLFSHVIYLLFHKQYREKFHTPAAVARSVAGHRAILAAVVAGDAERARSLMAEHVGAA